MNGFRLPLAAVATVVVVAFGGFFLLNTGSSGPGASSASTSPEPSPRASSSPAAGTAGQMALLRDDCTWTAHYETVFPGTFTVDVGNETQSLAVFDFYRLRSDRTFDEALSVTAQAQEALRAGAELPAAFFELAVPVPDSAIRLPAMEHGTLTITAAEPGTYGVVCSENEPESEDVIAVYLVGPLEVVERPPGG